MKKILFGGASALLAVVGFSSFKTSGVYFFKTNVDKTGLVAFQPTEVTYLPGGPSSTSCNIGSFDCVVTFATSALNANHTALIQTTVARETIGSRTAL